MAILYIHTNNYQVYNSTTVLLLCAVMCCTVLYYSTINSNTALSEIKYE